MRIAQREDVCPHRPSLAFAPRPGAAICVRSGC
jgi:hypothetical protein